MQNLISTTLHNDPNGFFSTAYSSLFGTLQLPDESSIHIVELVEYFFPLSFWEHVGTSLKSNVKCLSQKLLTNPCLADNWDDMWKLHVPVPLALTLCHMTMTGVEKYENITPTFQQKCNSRRIALLQIILVNHDSHCNMLLGTKLHISTHTSMTRFRAILSKLGLITTEKSYHDNKEKLIKLGNAVVKDLMRQAIELGLPIIIHFDNADWNDVQSDLAIHVISAMASFGTSVDVDDSRIVRKPLRELTRSEVKYETSKQIEAKVVTSSRRFAQALELWKHEDLSSLVQQQATLDDYAKVQVVEDRKLEKRQGKVGVKRPCQPISSNEVFLGTCAAQYDFEPTNEQLNKCFIACKKGDKLKVVMQLFDIDMKCSLLLVLNETESVRFPKKPRRELIRIQVQAGSSDKKVWVNVPPPSRPPPPEPLLQQQSSSPLPPPAPLVQQQSSPASSSSNEVIQTPVDVSSSNIVEGARVDVRTILTSRTDVEVACDVRMSFGYLPTSLTTFCEGSSSQSDSISPVVSAMALIRKRCKISKVQNILDDRASNSSDISSDTLATGLISGEAILETIQMQGEHSVATPKLRGRQRIQHEDAKVSKGAYEIVQKHGGGPTNPTSSAPCFVYDGVASNFVAIQRVLARCRELVEEAAAGLSFTLLTCSDLQETELIMNEKNNRRLALKRKIVFFRKSLDALYAKCLNDIGDAEQKAKFNSEVSKALEALDNIDLETPHLIGNLHATFAGIRALFKVHGELMMRGLVDVAGFGAKWEKLEKCANGYSDIALGLFQAMNIAWLAELIQFISSTYATETIEEMNVYGMCNFLSKHSRTFLAYDRALRLHIPMVMDLDEAGDIRGLDGTDLLLSSLKRLMGLFSISGNHKYVNHLPQEIAQRLTAKQKDVDAIDQNPNQINRDTGTVMHFDKYNENLNIRVLKHANPHPKPSTVVREGELVKFLPYSTKLLERQLGCEREYEYHSDELKHLNEIVAAMRFQFRSKVFPVVGVEISKVFFIT